MCLYWFSKLEVNPILSYWIHNVEFIEMGEKKWEKKEEIKIEVIISTLARDEISGKHVRWIHFDIFGSFFSSLHLFCMHKTMNGFHGWRSKRRLLILWTVYFFILFFFFLLFLAHAMINTIEVKKLMKANQQWRQ